MINQITFQEFLANGVKVWKNLHQKRIVRGRNYQTQKEKQENKQNCRKFAPLVRNQTGFARKLRLKTAEYATGRRNRESEAGNLS